MCFLGDIPLRRPGSFSCRQTVAYEDRGLVTVANPKGDDDDPPKNFTFDAVFAAEVTQRHIYDVCAAELIDACLNGYNGTIFA